MEDQLFDRNRQPPTVVGLLQSAAEVLRKEGLDCDANASAIEDLLVGRGLGHLPEITVALQHFDALAQVLDNVAGMLSILAESGIANSSLANSEPEVVRRAVGSVALTDLRKRLVRSKAEANRGDVPDRQIEIWDDPEI